MSVQNRAQSGEPERMHLAFLVSRCDDERIAEVANAVQRLGRVQRLMVLGVLE
jgi:hypothetical protein